MNTRIVAIGNGIYARERVKEPVLGPYLRVQADRMDDWAKREYGSIYNAYLRLQASCPHQQRDPKGKCYLCGHEIKRIA